MIMVPIKETRKVNGERSGIQTSIIMNYLHSNIRYPNIKKEVLELSSAR
jgi:hypothetical protein